jgi:phage host-nuclease inhibitor protein Gam
MTTTQTIQGLKGEVSSLFRNLQNVEYQVTQQEFTAALQKEELVKMTDANDKLAATLEAIIPIVVLLREELEELDIVIAELFNKNTQ